MRKRRTDKVGAAKAEPGWTHIYVIGDVDGPQKIGIARKPNERRLLLQIGNSTQLRVHAAIPVRGHVALAAEKHAHAALRDRHVRGEWFEISPDDAERIVIDAINAVADSTPQIPATDESSTISLTDLASPVLARRVQIRAARRYLDWTIRDLAEKSCVSMNAISRMESGSTEASVGTMARLQIALERAGIVFPDERTLSCPSDVPEQVKKRRRPTAGR